MASDDAANVFAIPDFWRTSKWLDQLPEDHAAAFFPKNLIGRYQLRSAVLWEIRSLTCCYRSLGSSKVQPL